MYGSSPENALRRLDLLCQRANVPSQLPLIAAAVQLVVELRREAHVRPRVVDVAHLDGLDPSGRFVLQRFERSGLRQHMDTAPLWLRQPVERPARDHWFTVRERVIIAIIVKRGFVAFGLMFAVQFQAYMMLRDAAAGVLLYIDREGQNATRQFFRPVRSRHGRRRLHAQQFP